MLLHKSFIQTKKGKWTDGQIIKVFFPNFSHMIFFDNEIALHGVEGYAPVNIDKIATAVR